jgi:Arc/MetJ-type ribon-helix-helix transcriptional regulator
MKISVSLPSEDIIYVDEYAHRKGSSSRSSVLHHAIDLLRLSELEEAYASAWDEWAQSEDAALWDAIADEATRAAR